MTKERELVYDFENLKCWEVFNRDDLKNKYKDYPARIIGFDFFKVKTPKEFYFQDGKSSVFITEKMEKPMSLEEYQGIMARAKEESKKLVGWATIKFKDLPDPEKEIARKKTEQEIQAKFAVQAQAMAEIGELAQKYGYEKHSWQQQGPCSNWGTVFYKGKKMFEAREFDWVDDLKRFKEFLKENE